MSDHTKGPWEAVNTSVRQIASSCIVAKAVEDTASDAVTSREQALANAKLIAAAPDLLNALRELFATLEPDISGSPGSSLEKARAAIKKATGGNS